MTAPQDPATDRSAVTEHRALNHVLVWTGIAAAAVFIVAVVFFSGFYLGRSTDGLSGNHHWNHMSGPGMMGPGMMGPGMGPQHCQMAPTGQSPPPTAPPRMTPNP
ncbi:hypothetical protein [Mycolicibacterium elephantis]|uniref:hypothetical protein n=1 Tax=Mycolicibacterium elephantis TaxID=81858 RepID=UPI001F4E6B12|nr:hypothetical protein [Mycolicibacterium elephantis]